MSHLESPQYNRVSLKTIHLNYKVKPDLDFWVWGMVDGLDVVSTDESVLKIVDKKTLPGNYLKFTVRGLKNSGAALPRIQVKLNNDQIWDYLSVDVSDTALPPGYDEVHNYVHPGKVVARVNFFWEVSAADFSLSHYAEVARMLLLKHGLGLNISPGRGRTENRIIKYNEELSSMDQLHDLMKLVQGTGLAIPSWLTVINSRFHPSAHAFGLTVKTESDCVGSLGPQCVFIDGGNHSSTGTTLLHEMGHASGLGHTAGGNAVSAENFMNDPRLGTPTGPDVVASQVKSIAAAYFSR